MQIKNNGYFSIEQLTEQYLSGTQKSDNTRETKEGLSFQQVLQQKTLQNAGSLKFSKHALGRLNDRSIELSEGQLERLNQGAQKAGQKGIKDSLVIVDELAFIVNVPNQTVVTAMDSTETNSNIFTNINGAVIM
ncbi:MAG: flagellar protein [Lachnospiraceae bacterium]|jgi:flagellar operon protein|nr:flagellar protein [Lachnospiraceae bacterium]MCI9674434.1 flagellar protein [Lachnospiraceae bacterium]